MDIVWTPELSVGIQEIDRQHQELFDHINGLLSGLHIATPTEKVAEMFDFLENYVEEHFSAEERYMDDQLAGYYGDTDARRHRGEHAAFIRDYREYRADLKVTGVTEQMTAEFRNWMRNWWLMHVSGTDRKLGASLRARYPFMK